MSFVGNIKGWTITEMLQLIRQMKKTGAMIVTTDDGDVQKKVFFRNGLVIAVDTGSEDLGAILLEENMITRADLDQAIAYQKQHRDKRIEQILLAMKKVDAPKLVKAIRIQIERVITALLQEKSAKVAFDPEAPLTVQGLSNGVDIQGIMLTASVKVDELELVRQRIPNVNAVPRKTKRGEEEMNEISLKLAEWKVFLAVDGKTDIKTLALKLRMEEVSVLKCLVVLLDGKWIEIVEGQKDTRKKILAVDDSKVILKTIQLALSETGHSLITAESGKAALELALEHRPDLILLDVMLPDTTGLKICKTIRTDAEYEAIKDAPIVMLSAKDAEIDKNLGLHAGANDYITKPFKDGELLQVVERFLKKTEPVAS